MSIFAKKEKPKIVGSQTQPFNTMIREIPTPLTCDMILKNVFVESLLNTQAQHILSSNIRVQGAGWQAEKWTDFLINKSFDVITEWYSQAMVYGQCHCDFLLGYDLTGRYIVKDLIPFDMYYVQEYTDLYYNGYKIDKTRIQTLTLRTIAGQPVSCQNQLSEPIRRLNDLTASLPEAVIRNCLGSINFDIDMSNPFATTDTTQLTALKDEYNKSMSVISSIPGLKATIISNAQLKDYGGYEVALRNIMDLLYTYFNMGWLSMGITETGAFNAYLASLRNYAKYLDVQANRICAVLNNIVDREAYNNGEISQIEFIHEPIDFEVQTTVKTMIREGKVKDLIDTGVVSIDEVRKELSLEPMAQQQPMIEKPTQTFEAMLANKKIGVLRALTQAIERKRAGGSLQFILTDKKRFAGVLNIDENTLSIEWANFELALKTLCMQAIDNNLPIESLFETTWQQIAEKLWRLYESK